MTRDRHPGGESVTAPLTQLATGLPVETEACPGCGRPLRAGTPVSVQLTRGETRWYVHTVCCQQCPPPHPPAQQPSHRLAATLSMWSHVHTQTHTLALADLERDTPAISTSQ